MRAILPRLSRAGSGQSRARSPVLFSLSFEAADDQRHILAAEAETAAERVFEAFFACLVGNVVEVAGRVGRFVVDRWGQDAALDRHDAGDELDGAGRDDQV